MILGIDLGTTAIKVVGLTEQGELLGTVSEIIPLITPQAGWVEQSTSDVWQALGKAVRILRQQFPAESLTAIGLSGAMHSLLTVGKDGNPLSTATTWIDNRAAALSFELKTDPALNELYYRTGSPVQAIYYPARIRWMRKNHPDQFSRADMFVGIKDWVIHQMTGNWLTDSDMASTTGLLNIHHLEWDQMALDVSGLQAKRLPAVQSSRTIAGGLIPVSAEQLSLPAGIPVVLGASDGALANLGSGARDPDSMTITIGTSGAVRRILSSPWLDSFSRTWCYCLYDNLWLAGGAINNGGLAVQWARDRLFPEGYDQLFLEAGQVPPGAQNLICLPYFTGERCPHWNPDLRACFYGLGLEHSRAHIARAVLEGVAFCLADVWQILQASGEPPPFFRLTGGITRSPVWMQILADVLGMPLLPIEAADASAVGAAQMAAWALSEQASPPDWPLLTGEMVEPDLSRHDAYINLHHRFQAYSRELSTT